MARKNMVTRSVVLSPERDERLNKLCEATGYNRNLLVNIIAAKAKPEDIEEMTNRV